MNRSPRTESPTADASRRATAEARRLYQLIAEDARYGHYVRIPERTFRCLEYFGAASDHAAVVERLRSYYLFIGVADDALDSQGAGAGDQLLRSLRARVPSFDAETRRSRVRLVTEVFKSHIAPDIYPAVLAKLERLYVAVVGEKESTTMADYIEQRRVVGRLTAEVSYLLIRPLLARGRTDLRRFLREVGEVGCLVDSAIDLRSDERLGLLGFRPAPADYLRLAALTLQTGLRVLKRHPRLAGLFMAAVCDDLRDRVRARRSHAVAGPEIQVSSLEFRV